MRSILISAVLAFLPFSAVLAQSTTRVLLPHQGFLTGPDDAPVDGTVSLTFRLYENATKPAESTETAIWSGTYEVRPSRGRYSVLLGATDGNRPPLVGEFFSATAPRYLAVEINQLELSPRLRLGVVPNAVKAEEAAHALDSARVGGQTLADLDARYARLSSGSSGISFGATVTAPSFAGSGAQLTSLNATSLDSGTLAEARLPTTLTRGYTFSGAQNRFAGDGSGLEALDASKVATGILPGARLGGTYAQALQLTNAANAISGSFTGDLAGNVAGNVTGAVNGTGAFTQLKLPVGAAAAGTCDASRLGHVYVDTGDGSLRYCNGTAWRALRPRPAQVFVSAYSVDFGTLTRSAAATRTVTVTNTGDEPLASLQFAASGTGFTQANDCAAQLAPNAGCTVTITFTPSGANGARTGALAISSDGTQLVSVSLAATVQIRSFRLNFDNNVTDLDGRYVFATSAAGSYSTAYKAGGSHSVQVNVYNGRPADYAVASSQPDPTWSLGPSTGDFDLEWSQRHQQDIGYSGVIASNTLSWANTQGTPLANGSSAGSLSDASGWVLAIGWTAGVVHFATGGGSVTWTGSAAPSTSATFRRMKLSRRGSTLEFFLDGTSLGTRAQPTFTPAATSTLYLVGSTNGTAYTNPSPSLYLWVDDMKFTAY